MVTSQLNKSEIATKQVIAHCYVMATAPKILSELRTEMSKERIGQRLRLLRIALGMTPSQMADDLGIERTYWSRFERGQRALNDDTAALLVVKHGVTLDFLILGRWDKLPYDLAEAMRSIEEK